MDYSDQVGNIYESMYSVLDERQRRLMAAAQAAAYGYGGVTFVAAATGLSRTTIQAGLKELQELKVNPPILPSREQPVRKPGAGRKPLTQTDPTLLSDLDQLIDPLTRGDPQSPLRWTCKSTRRLAKELNEQGHRVSPRTVALLLQQQNYSLQANSKTEEGCSSPDRDAQFQHIYKQTLEFQSREQPVISVDTKKKENIGNFKNPGEEWQKAGEPERVNVHDFPDKGKGKAIPHGVYDITTNQGWVTVGTDHDTAEFAVHSIGNWWDNMGKETYPEATELLITADGGGSNATKSRMWKAEMQNFADESGLSISVCHFPPGTSKWNKIEHRMFCHITENWRGRPLISHDVVVNLIANTTTNKGLTICAALDTSSYAKGIKISDEEMEAIEITRAEFHGEWNYKISPRIHQIE